MNTVLLIGAGNHGSRHLQGLCKSTKPLRIDILDQRAHSIDLAKHRAEEVLAGCDSDIKLNFITDTVATKREYDVAISATTSDQRLVSLEKLRCNVNYWLMEKVLAQNVTDLLKLRDKINGANEIWVNTMFRLVPWLAETRNELSKLCVKSISVKGGRWNIPCNAVHYIDYISWLSGKRLTKIETAGLSPTWFESKRPGYFDVFGSLRAIFEGNLIVDLEADDTNDDIVIEIKADRSTWLINENQGTSSSSDGKYFHGCFSLQSDLTGLVVDQILTHGTCDLPCFSTALEQHQIFLSAMLAHWRQFQDHDAQSVPIT